MYIDSTVSAHDVLSIGALSIICFQQSGYSIPLEVGATYIFFNLTMSKTRLMHGNIPWRRAREKNLESLQFLVEALTKPGDVVFDAYASTC